MKLGRAELTQGCRQLNCKNGTNPHDSADARAKEDYGYADDAKNAGGECEQILWRMAKK